MFASKTTASFSLRADVTLGDLNLDHAPNMYRWMCDPAVSQNLGLRSEPSLEKTRVWIEHALQDPCTRPFAILLKGRHVGNVVLDRIDSYLSTARLSVYIGEASARKSGIGQTGIYLALSEGFHAMRLHKIWLTVHANNLAAIRTYCRCGFVLEGILRDEFWLEGKRVGVLYFGMLRDEFLQLCVGRSDGEL